MYEPLVGDEFTFTPEGGQPVRVLLTAVEPTPYGDPGSYEGRRMPFSLIFHAVVDGAHLEQQTLALTHPAAGSTPLFVVPLGPDGRGMRYEAVIS